MFLKHGHISAETTKTNWTFGLDCLSTCIFFCLMSGCHENFEMQMYGCCIMTLEMTFYWTAPWSYVEGRNSLILRGCPCFHIDKQSRSAINETCPVTDWVLQLWEAGDVLTTGEARRTPSWRLLRDLPKSRTGWTARPTWTHCTRRLYRWVIFSWWKPPSSWCLAMSRQKFQKVISKIKHKPQTCISHFHSYSSYHYMLLVVRHPFWFGTG